MHYDLEIHLEEAAGVEDVDGFAGFVYGKVLRVFELVAAEHLHELAGFIGNNYATIGIEYIDLVGGVFCI